MKYYQLRYYLLLPFLLLAYPFLMLHGLYILRHMPDLQPPNDHRGQIGDGGNPLRVLALGESSVAGIGVETHKDGVIHTITQILSKKLQQSFIYEIVAQSGYTAQQTIDLLLDKINMQNPDLIIIGLGGNDTFRANFPWTWRKTIENLIHQLHNHGLKAPILFLNLPPVRDFPAFHPIARFFAGEIADALGKELEALSNNTNTIYFPKEKVRVKDWVKRHYEYTKLEVPDLFSDGIHPTLLTYQVWALEMSTFIMEKGIFEKKV